MLKNTRCNYFRIICVSSWFCHKQNIKMSEVHRMKVYVSHCHRECIIRCQLILTQFPALVSIFTEPGADHDQEWDQGILTPSPGLLMIYALHLPQAMRGTTLNEQHKPHSLMSNFSIAYFWDIGWFMICLTHYRWWPHYPGVAWVDVTHQPMTRDDNLTWSQTIYQNNPDPDPGPVMKSVKTNF